MIAEYEFTLQDEKRNAKQLVCYLYRRLFLPAVMSAAMGVATLVLALTVLTDVKPILYLACLLLAGTVFILLSFVLVYVLSVKNTEKAFAMYSTDGKEKFSIEYEEGIYTFCNISKGNVVKYSATDIVSVIPYKNLLLLKLVSKQIVSCPNDATTRQMFAGYLQIKNRV